MRFLHVTDSHFGLPANSVGLKRKVLVAAAGQLVRSRVATLMATHDETAIAALRVFVELERDYLDGIIVSGDAATTGDRDDLRLAHFNLETIAEATPYFVLPGNHDRFGQPWRYPPTSRDFERVFPSAHLVASPFGMGSKRVGDCVLVGIDASLDSLTGIPGRGRRLGHGLIRSDVSARLDRILQTHADASHIIIVIHFPIQIQGTIPADHVAFGGDALVREIFASTGSHRRPTLVVSGHLHREYFVRHFDVPLWFYTGGTVSKQYPWTSSSRHSCAVIQTRDDGFEIQRYDLDRSNGVHAFEAVATGPTNPSLIDI